MNLGKSPPKPARLRLARKGERISDLSEGMQQQLREFERAVRRDVMHSYEHDIPSEEAHIKFERAKRKFIMKLWVTEGFAKDLISLTKRKR